MKSIFAYSSYRQFLKDHYVEKKRAKELTYERFSKKAGIKSPNLIKLVIDGKKNLSSPMIHRFSKALELNFDETEHFTNMVYFDQALAKEERQFYRKKIQSLRAKKPVYESETSLSGILSRWYYPSILVALEGFKTKNSTSGISSYLSLPASEVESTIRILLNSGAMRIEEDTYRMVHQNLNLKDSKKRSAAHRNFLRAQAQKSMEILAEPHRKRSRFYSQTFSISKDDYEYCVSQVESLLDELSRVSDQSPVEELIQVNTHIYAINEKKNEIKNFQTNLPSLQPGENRDI